ncbi:MAG: histidine phosphatase family protein [Pseudomonadota bacterium]|nr:histidine phosphatase family protein [Pseudomonadota bacterium]|tara:strand:+ start:257 stop:820 length:564 start_codon:yes stop_codon:yes gene_type:complete
MKNKIISLLANLFLLFQLTSHLYASDQTWNLAQEGNKIILIRHSLAPGGGDPTGFKINDCKTQRNLNRTGINQSKKIGKLFKKNKVPVDQVLTSQWCRCKDTAKYAFGNYKEFTALNSTFQSPYNKNEGKQLKDLYSFVKKWNGKGKNLVLITHYSIITAVTNAVPSSGEIVVADKNFKVLGTIQTD